jgi:inositol-phosphate transport system permease protein
MSRASGLERGGTPPLSPAHSGEETSSIGVRLRSRLEAYTFLSPAVLLVTLFFFIPVVIIFILSLSNLKAANFGTLQWWLPANWSLDNYAKIFGNKFFPKILGNTFFYVAVTLTLFNFSSALLIAVLTTHIERRTGFFFRVLWLLPRLTPSVIYIMMWQRMASRAPHGILNQLLVPLGIGTGGDLIQAWPWAFVIVVNGMIGASLTLSLLTSFEQILLLTEGGPGLYRTEVWALMAYHRALSNYFGNNQWGYGAAWAVILVIIGVAAASIYMRVFKFDELVQEPRIDLL